MKNSLNKIDTKISLYFFTFALLIVLLLTYTSYKKSYDILIENKQRQTEQEILSASQYMEAYFDKIRGLACMLSMPPEVKKIQTVNVDKAGYIHNLLSITKKNDPIIKRITIVSANGKIITTNPTNFLKTADMMQLDWYKQLVDSKHMAFITAEDHQTFGTNKAERVISLSHEIVDKKGGIVGMVVVDLSYKFVEDHLSKMNFGSQGYTFISTSEDKLVFDSKQMEKPSLEENEKYKKLITGRMKSLEGGFVGAAIKIPNTDWTLVGVSSTEDVSRLTKRIAGSTILWLLIILMLSVALSVLISKWVSKPVVDLIAGMKKVENDFAPLAVDKRASVEIRQLTMEYNLLLDRIHKLTINIEEKEKAKRVFELKALQSQINPHFIYNTLDTIMWLIEFNENQKAIEVTKSLGKLLRRSLSGNQDFVELDNELNHVKNYMDIQKIRYDDKFDYVFDVEEGTNKLLVPKLILQPIVENSIYHGIRPKHGKSYIRISAYIIEGDLEIVVEDNGMGVHDKFDKLTRPKLGGIGMSNVDQRIKILCGETYGIRLISSGQITKVVYRLKVKYFTTPADQNRQVPYFEEAKQVLPPTAPTPRPPLPKIDMLKREGNNFEEHNPFLYDLTKEGLQKRQLPDDV